MNGTGTQNDPYIITTVAELYSMASAGGAGVYFALGNDLDFNDTPYAEHFQTIEINGSSLDGRGHTIRNIYYNSLTDSAILFKITPHSNALTAVSGLRLENCHLYGNEVYLFTANGEVRLSVYNCAFILNVRRYSTSTPSTQNCLMRASGYVSITNVELCTFSIQGTFVRCPTFFKSHAIKRCHIHLELQLSRYVTSSPESLSIFLENSITDSYVTGWLSTTSTSTTGVAALANTCCFYDSELAGNTVFDKTSTFLGLTTAQCKNVDYLQSIGFIVEGTD